MHPHVQGRLAIVSAIVALSLVACTREVATGLDEAEANRGVVALSRAGFLDVEKTADAAAEGRYRLSVSNGDAADAIALLAAEEIPRVRTKARDPEMFASAEGERLARLDAVAGEMERSIASLDGVVDARIHLDVPRGDPLAALAAAAPGERPAHATASVLVRHRGAAPSLAVADIRRLVAGGVAGLAAEDVAVVLATVPPTARTERSGVRFGPIVVARASVGVLRSVAVAVLGTIALLACAVLVLAARLRRRNLAEGAGAE